MVASFGRKQGAPDNMAEGEIMIRKKRFVALLLGALCTVALMAGVFGSVTAFADSNESEAEPYGIFTRLSVKLVGSGGVMSAVATNELTLLPSTVELHVELYRSTTYQEDCANMECVARNYTPDLNMGDTISASYSTGYEQWYWQGRIYYSFDQQEWKWVVTGCYLADGLGGLIL